MLEDLMKTGLFELRIERDGDWVITPLIGDFSIRVHDGKEWGPESNFPFEYPDGWVNWEFSDDDNLKDFSTWHESIPWYEIPERYKWVAMDKSGYWFAYEEAPKIRTKEWVSYGAIGVVVCYMPTPTHWTNSLVRRPSYE